ncbi:MAG: A/G-specific adenine glycosylase [Deltaproteobacteria bacterium]|nr:A/G-specific adenine glycosylase [Deltaproteobacteria bacterium]
MKIKTAVVRRLSAWYKRNKRVLPWRETTDPYRIWISEIMLQQTQVDTVIPYYRRFLDIFPNVDALAVARLEDVLKAWENMGYYARARQLHRCAGMIVDKYGGKIPDTLAELTALPGIGAYTAGAVLSMAYGQAVPAVDGNVRRILARLFAVRKPLDDLQTQKQLHQTAATLVPSKKPGDFNQALMDLGAAVCKAKKTLCTLCPLARLCQARILELQDGIPAKKKRPSLPHRQAAAAIIQNRDGLFLVVQRPATGLLASLWTFPGGFVEDGKTLKSDLIKRVREQLGIRIRIGEHLAEVRHAYTHFRITLHACKGYVSKETPKALACRDWRWITPAGFAVLPSSKIDRMIMQTLLSEIKM